MSDCTVNLLREGGVQYEIQNGTDGEIVGQGSWIASISLELRGSIGTMPVDSVNAMLFHQSVKFVHYLFKSFICLIDRFLRHQDTLIIVRVALADTVAVAIRMRLRFCFGI